jgi:NitT/TauT family transport system ATP-binding protein
MIKLANLTFSYGEKTIFKDLSYTFADKKIYGIVGESGSGKTTLLSLILGLLPFSGELTKDGRVVAVFQEDRLCENISAFKNVFITYKNRQKVHDDLLAVGLTKTEIHKPVNQLSGGMKRRVALVRAIIQEAEILLIDEGFNNIDDENKELVFTYLLNKTKNTTVIIVSHDRRELESLGAEIIEIRNLCS